jgi:hypothetical protein
MVCRRDYYVNIEAEKHKQMKEGHLDFISRVNYNLLYLLTEQSVKYVTNLTEKENL